MSVYRSLEGPYTKADFEVYTKIPHAIVTEMMTFRHCNLPIMGVGPNGHSNPFLYFDKYFDTKLLKQIRNEVVAAEEKKLLSFNKIVANGLIPTKINNQKTVDSYIDNIAKYAKDDTWIESINKLKRKGDIKIFFHDYFGIKTAWEGLAMFRKYNASYEDKSKPSDWLDSIVYYPTLQKFVESLPFKYVGYVMIFKSNGKNPVLTHRDYYPTNHNVNFINFRLEQKKRPFFLYDLHTHTKKYVDQESDSYFFNEIDAHGLDIENESRMTLRVEGQFLEAFKEQIGLLKTDTFNWEFEHCDAFLKNGLFKIEQSTDI